MKYITIDLLRVILLIGALALLSVVPNDPQALTIVDWIACIAGMSLSIAVVAEYLWNWYYMR